MAVSGIYDSFHSGYSVQQIQMPYVDAPVKTGSAAAAQEYSAPSDMPDQADDSAQEGTVRENRAGRMADLDNVSLTFNKKDDFGFIGMDSDPEGLDMQKAISDMQKDQVLQSYQYFVGSAGSLLGEQSSADGTVIVKP